MTMSEMAITTETEKIGGNSTLDLYKLARSQIEHENTLVSQRITWYLTLQGFLFAAMFVVVGVIADPQKLYCESETRLYLTIAIFLLQFVGTTSSLVCYLLIRAAYKQIDRVVEWWKGLKVREETFPAVTGTGGITVVRYNVTGADFSLIIMVVWLVMLGLLVHTVFRGGI